MDCDPVQDCDGRWGYMDKNKSGKIFVRGIRAQDVQLAHIERDQIEFEKKQVRLYMGRVELYKDKIRDGRERDTRAPRKIPKGRNSRGAKARSRRSKDKGDIK